MQGIEIPIGAPLGQLSKDLNGAKGKINQFANQTNSTLGKLSSGTSALMGTVALSIAGAFSVQSIIGFTKEVFAATAQFQKFEAVLGNTLGSSALAKLKLAEIQDFAAKTPFGVNELTNAFVKLANQGFKPTGDQMKALGDLASSTGKSFDMLAEAIIDAQVGEFERLKEFGVRAQDAGDKVIFTFKGVQTTVNKTSESIRGYITSLGKAEGVSGSMAVISETLGGKISNLGDSWDQMLISVGANTSGIFSGAISIIGKAVDAITDYNKRIELVNKFKLKEDFGLNFQQGGLKISDVKGEVAQVESAQKSVQKYIKSVQEIAKTPAEFKSALQGLSDLAKQQIAGLNNANLSKAIVQQYVDGINTLKELGKEAAKIKPPDANFGNKTGKSDAEKRAEKIIELTKQLKEQKLENYLSGLDIAFKLSGQGFEVFKNSISQTRKEIQADLTSKPLIDVNTLMGGSGTTPQNITQKLYTPFEILKDEINFDLLPSLGTSFQTFFDEMLIRGKFSFKSLADSIKNTFLSVLASDATTGLLNLLGAKGQDGGKMKGSGLLGGVLGLIGGKGGGEGAATKGIGKLLGTVVPIAGIALGAASILGGLFKKKKDVPLPAQTSSISTQASGSTYSDFSGGRVVFEISGVNLIGVLNRAGAKLQRFGP